MPPSLTPKKVTELDLAGTLSGQEWFPLVQGGQTKKAQLDSINAFNNGSCKCTLVSRSNAVGNDANTLEKFLQTYTLESNTLVNDGERLEIKAGGVCAANANGKNITFYFGSSQFSSSDAVVNNATWEFNATVFRTSNTTQKISARVFVFGFSSSWIATTMTGKGDSDISGAETLSSDIQIKFSGRSATGSANDVVCDYFVIDLHKLDPDS